MPMAIRLRREYSLKPSSIRIHSNDLSNVATAAAAATTHLNHLTVNNTHNNITNTNIQVSKLRDDFICKVKPERNYLFTTFHRQQQRQQVRQCHWRPSPELPLPLPPDSYREASWALTTLDTTTTRSGLTSPDGCGF